jgi:2,3-bisphosphoglycerate-dependent phosphoglycerate mutase
VIGFASAGSTLLLLCHGETVSDTVGEFAGWIDTPLTGRGERQAGHAAEVIRRSGMIPDSVHTSVLRRSTDTARIVLDSLGRPRLPVRRSWRLNDRHLGALTGHDKDAVRTEFGDQRYARWLHSFTATPPPLPAPFPDAAHNDPRYQDVPARDLPSAESLFDVVVRLMPYWAEHIVPELCAGRVPLVIAHANSLRALVSHLDRLGPDQVTRLDIPAGIPLLYDLDASLHPIVAGGVRLNQVADGAPTPLSRLRTTTVRAGTPAGHY